MSQSFISFACFHAATKPSKTKVLLVDEHDKKKKDAKKTLDAIKLKPKPKEEGPKLATLQVFSALVYTKTFLNV